MWESVTVDPPRTGYVTCARFSPDSSRVAVCTTSGNIEVRRSSDLGVIAIRQVHSKSVNEVRWSRTSDMILSCSDDGTLVLSLSSDLTRVVEFRGHHSYVLTCDISNTELRVVSGSYDESVRIWDTAQGKCLKFISAHSEPVSSVVFSNDATFVVSGSWDGVCRLWDTFSGTCIKAFQVCFHPITFSTISPNDRFILAASDNSVIKIIRIEDAKTLGIYKGHVNKQFCLFASFAVNEQERTEIFSPSEDGRIVGWDLNTQQVTWELDLPNAGPTLCADVNRHGNLLVAAGSTDQCHDIFLFKRGSEGFQNYQQDVDDNQTMEKNIIDQLDYQQSSNFNEVNNLNETENYQQQEMEMDQENYISFNDGNTNTLVKQQKSEQELSDSYSSDIIQTESDNNNRNNNNSDIENSDSNVPEEKDDKSVDNEDNANNDENVVKAVENQEELELTNDDNRENEITSRTESNSDGRYQSEHEYFSPSTTPQTTPQTTPLTPSIPASSIQDIQATEKEMPLESNPFLVQEENPIEQQELNKIHSPIFNSPPTHTESQSSMAISKSSSLPPPPTIDPNMTIASAPPPLSTPKPPRDIHISGKSPKGSGVGHTEPPPRPPTPQKPKNLSINNLLNEPSPVQPPPSPVTTSLPPPQPQKPSTSFMGLKSLMIDEPPQQQTHAHAGTAKIQSRSTQKSKHTTSTPPQQPQPPPQQQQQQQQQQPKKGNQFSISSFLV